MDNKTSVILIALMLITCVVAVFTNVEIAFRLNIDNKSIIEIDVKLLNDKHLLNNGTINMLYGEEAGFVKEDFEVIAILDDGSNKRIYNFDFSTNITQNVAVGEYRLEFKYKNLSKEIKVIINPVSLNNENIVINKIEDCEYTGIEINPSVSIKFKDNLLLEGVDYDLEYSNNINVTNNAVVRILGKGNFEGILINNFIITPKILEVGDWLYAAPYIYNGDEFNVKLNKIAPELNVEYINNKNTNAGLYLAKANLTLKPGYDSNNYIVPTVNDLSWEIKSKSLSLASIIAEDVVVYTGNEIELEIKIGLGELILENSIDYTISYINNLNVSDNAKAVIIGKGNYTGQIYHIFKIIPKNINLNVEWDYPVDGYIYSGKVYDVKIKNLPNYLSVTYQGNSASEVNNYYSKAIVELKPEYRDNFTLLNTEFELNWQIKPISILRCEIESIDNQIYTGSELKPSINIRVLMYNNETNVNDKVVILQEGIDYQIRYLNNINPGRATMIINGIGNYCDRLIKGFDIKKDDI